MSNIINGKELSLKIEDEIRTFAKACIIRPSVAVINIGNDPISEKFIKAKEEACNRAGIYFRYHQYEEGTPELTIINKIKELNNDDYVNGIMIELPIPDKYNEKRLLNTIINSKDVDGLTDINVGRAIGGRKTLMPPTVLAIMTLLKENNIELEGKHVVVVGKGKLVGKPIIFQLLTEGATVTVCHSKTIDLAKHTKEADVIISAVGEKHLISEDMVKKDSIIIDVGCSYEAGKIYGDVDPKVSKKASYMPDKTGSVGPLSIAMFLKNIMSCYNSKK